MALLGAPKGRVVSGELSAFRPTFFSYLKVKWREVRIPAVAERHGGPVALGYRLPRRSANVAASRIQPQRHQPAHQAWLTSMIMNHLREVKRRGRKIRSGRDETPAGRAVPRSQVSSVFLLKVCLMPSAYYSGEPASRLTFLPAPAAVPRSSPPLQLYGGYPA